MSKTTTRTLSRKLEKVNHMKTADVITRSGISKNYVYNILNGDKKNPGRDKVLALCIGAGMTYRQTQRGLALAKVAPLYPKDERDIRIAVALNKGMNWVLDVNLILEEYNLNLIEV